MDHSVYKAKGRRLPFLWCRFVALWRCREQRHVDGRGLRRYHRLRRLPGQSALRAFLQHHSHATPARRRLYDWCLQCSARTNPAFTARVARWQRLISTLSNSSLPLPRPQLRLTLTLVHGGEVTGSGGEVRREVKLKREGRVRLTGDSDALYCELDDVLVSVSVIDPVRWRFRPWPLTKCLMGWRYHLGEMVTPEQLSACYEKTFRPVIDEHYALYSVAAVAAFPAMGVYHPFAMPGGSMYGIRLTGVRVAGLDRGAVSRAGPFFNKLGAPLATVVQEDAFHPEAMKRATDMHFQRSPPELPPIDIAWQFLSPNCQTTCTLYDVTVTLKTRDEDVVNRHLLDAVGMAHQAYLDTGLHYFVETTGGARKVLASSPFASCVANVRELHCGVASDGLHLIVHPPGSPPIVDRVLHEMYHDLQGRMCTGAKKPLLSLSADGEPVSCCQGNCACIVGGNPNLSTADRCRISRTPPNLIGSMRDSNNALPPDLSELLGHQGNMYALRHRLGIPAISFTEAPHGLLKEWLRKLLDLTAAREFGDPIFSLLPITQAIVVVLPHSLPGTIITDHFGRLLRLPLASDGTLVEEVANVLSRSFPALATLPARLSFVGDGLQLNEPSLVFMSCTVDAKCVSELSRVGTFGNLFLHTVADFYAGCEGSDRDVLEMVVPFSPRVGGVVLQHWRRVDASYAERRRRAAHLIQGLWRRTKRRCPKACTSASVQAVQNTVTTSPTQTPEGPRHHLVRFSISVSTDGSVELFFSSEEQTDSANFLQSRFRFLLRRVRRIRQQRSAARCLEALDIVRTSWISDLMATGTEQDELLEAKKLYRVFEGVCSRWPTLNRSTTTKNATKNASCPVPPKRVRDKDSRRVRKLFVRKTRQVRRQAEALTWDCAMQTSQEALAYIEKSDNVGTVAAGAALIGCLVSALHKPVKPQVSVPSGTANFVTIAPARRVAAARLNKLLSAAYANKCRRQARAFVNSLEEVYKRSATPDTVEGCFVNFDGDSDVCFLPGLSDWQGTMAPSRKVEALPLKLRINILHQSQKVFGTCRWSTDRTLVDSDGDVVVWYDSDLARWDFVGSQADAKAVSQLERALRLAWDAQDVSDPMAQALAVEDYLVCTQAKRRNEGRAIERSYHRWLNRRNDPRRQQFLDDRINAWLGSAEPGAEHAVNVIHQKLASSSKNQASVNSVSSARDGHRTPLWVRGVGAVSESGERRSIDESLVMGDTGASTYLLGADLFHDLERTGHARRVKGSSSSIREIAGIGGVVLVLFHASLSLTFGDHTLQLDDVPVIARHRGLLLGNDFNSNQFALIDHMPGEDESGRYDGTFIVRDKVGTHKGQLRFTTSAMVGGRSVHAAECFKTEVEGGSPIAYAPDATVVPAWSEAFISARLPDSATGAKTVAVLPLEDERADELGVAVAPGIYTLDETGYVKLRVVNPTNQRVPISAGTALAQFILDPTTEERDFEFTVDEIMKMINIDSKATQEDLVWIRQMIAARRRLFRSTVGWAHLFKATIDTPEVDAGRVAPPASRNMRYSPGELEALKKEVDKLLKQRIIERSRSPYNALPLLIRKPDGSFRTVLDFRNLNAVVTRDSYPLPNIDHNLAKLGKSSLFTTADLLSGFFQVELDDASKIKTAFGTPFGQFHFVRLPMGLTSAPGIFMRAVDSALRGLPPEIALAYLDDIIVPSSGGMKEHMAEVSIVFGRLVEAGFTVRADKLHVGKRDVPYLGFLVSKDGHRPMPQRTEAIFAVCFEQMQLDPKAPARFAGMIQFYHRFLPHLHFTLQAFNDLKKKSLTPAQRWDGLVGLRFQAAFALLKRDLARVASLARPDYSKPFELMLDGAATCGGGGVLGQCEDGEDLRSMRPLAFMSFSFTDEQYRYDVRQQECYVIFRAFKEWRPLLWGAKSRTHSDHRSLKWLMSTPHRAGEVTATWQAYLQEFDNVIEFIPGRDNIVADFFSRAWRRDALMLSGGKEQKVPPDAADGDSAGSSTVSRGTQSENLTEGSSFSAVGSEPLPLTHVALKVLPDGSVSLDVSAFLSPRRFRASRGVLAKGVFTTTINDLPYILVEHRDGTLNLPTAACFAGPLRAHLYDYFCAEYRGNIAVALSTALTSAKKYRPRNALEGRSPSTYFTGHLPPGKGDSLLPPFAVFVPFNIAVPYSFEDLSDFWFLRSVLDVSLNRPVAGPWPWRPKLKPTPTSLAGVANANFGQLPKFDRSRPRQPCWVQTVGEAQLVLESMHDAVKAGGVLALDLEGFLGGERRLNQHISLLQLAAQGHVDEAPITGVFDVHTCPELMRLPLLAELLSNDYAIKIVHSGRGDALSLQSLFGLSLSNVFDTAVADSILTSRHMSKGRGLKRCLQDALGDSIALDVKGQLVFDHDVDIFVERPLTSRLFTYAFQDVIFCPDLFRVQWTQLSCRQMLDLSFVVSSQRCSSLPTVGSQHNEPTLASVAIFDGSHVISMVSPSKRYLLPTINFFCQSDAALGSQARLSSRKAVLSILKEVIAPLRGSLARLGKAVRVGDNFICIARVASCEAILPALQSEFFLNPEVQIESVNVDEARASWMAHNPAFQYLHLVSEACVSATVNVVTGPTVTGERAALVLWDGTRTLILDSKRGMAEFPSLVVKTNSNTLKSAQDALGNSMGTALYKGGSTSYIMPSTAAIVDKCLQNIEELRLSGSTHYFRCTLPPGFLANYATSFYASRRLCNGFRPTPSQQEKYPSFRLLPLVEAQRLLCSFDAAVVAPLLHPQPSSQHNEPPSPPVVATIGPSGLGDGEFVAAVGLVFANLLDHVVARRSATARCNAAAGSSTAARKPWSLQSNGLAPSKPPSVEQIKSLQHDDPALASLIAALSEEPIEPVATSEDSEFLPKLLAVHSLNEDGLLCFQDRIVVPFDLRNDVMASIHNSLGHPGVNRMFPLLARRYFWGTRNSMRQDLARFIASCTACCYTKVPRHQAGEHHVMDTGEHPWDIVGVDKYSVGHTSSSEKTDTITFADYLGHGVICEPTVEEMNSEEYVRLTLRSLIRRKGVPRVIVSDRGSVLISKLVESLFEILGCPIRPSTAYMHRTVGIVERWHSVLKAMILALKSAGLADDWDVHLPLLELAHNNVVHSTTGYSPFFVEHLRHARLPGELFTTRPKNVKLDEFVTQTLDAQGVAYDSLVRKLNLNAISSKGRLDTRRDVTLKFAVGDRVTLVKGKFSDGVLPKAEFPIDGPYTISKILPNDNYMIRDKKALRIHNVIHVSRLLPLDERHIRKLDGAPHDARNGQWPVKAILNCRVTTKVNHYLNHAEGTPRLQYEIWWLDWPRDYGTWRESEHLVNVAELVIAYHTKHSYPPGFEPATLDKDAKVAPPEVKDKAKAVPHFRHHPQRSSVDEPAAAAPSTAPLPTPAAAAPQPRDISDRFPVHTRVEVQWLPDPTWWPGVVVKSRVYSPHDANLWYKRDRRVEVLYDEPETWGAVPYIHDLGDDRFLFRVPVGAPPPPTVEPVVPTPPAPPPSPPRGTRRSSRLAAL